MPTFTSTTKYALRWLTGTNPISDIDAGFQALAEDVDSKFAGYSHGTFAARPVSTGGTPGIAGRRYRADDTGQEFIDTGTSWVEIPTLPVTASDIEAQQAWQSITLLGGTWSPTALQYYKDSLGIVHFRGDAMSSPLVTGPATLCTLPAGYRPGSTQWFQMLHTSNGTPASFSISTAGVVQVVGNLAAAVLWSFGNVHFRAEN